jgi:hypothetical protein
MWRLFGDAELYRCKYLSSDSMLAVDREAHLPIESSVKVVAELMMHTISNEKNYVDEKAND